MHVCAGIKESGKYAHCSGGECESGKFAGIPK